MNADAERAALAGEFVFGLLDPAERRLVEHRLAREPELREEVLRWQRHAAPLNASAPPVQPSPGLWERIDASVRTEAPARRANSPMPFAGLWARFWGNLVAWRVVGMAGILGALLLSSVLGARIAQGPETPRLVAVLSAPDGRAAAVVNAYADGTVQLVPLDAIAAPEGRVLEVWTLQSRARGPVSLARMERARTIRLDLKGLSAAEVGHLFEITVEPLGGSPTGKPTGPILMKGLAAIRL